MNLRDLKYLVTLADCHHFGRAAEACFVSQPALSMQIKKLEDDLGVQLLERTNKSVLFTQIGKTITEQARAILLQVDEMREIAKLAKDPFRGEFSIGIIPTLAPYLLPHLVPDLSKSFPKLCLFLVEEPTVSLIAKLKQGKLDAALLALPVSEPEFVSTPLFVEEFVMAVSSHHSLAKQKVIKQTDLEDKVLLLLEDGHCMRAQALELCHRVNATEAKSFRATSLETLRHMVASNVGITLMPQLACQENDGITYIPFQSPRPSRLIGLVSRSTTAKKAVLKSVLMQIKESLAKQKMIKMAK